MLLKVLRDCRSTQTCNYEISTITFRTLILSLLLGPIVQNEIGATTMIQGDRFSAKQKRRVVLWLMHSMVILKTRVPFLSCVAMWRLECEANLTYPRHRDD